jgi:hypothetical protein
VEVLEMTESVIRENQGPEGEPSADDEARELKQETLEDLDRSDQDADQVRGGVWYSENPKECKTD